MCAIGNTATPALSSLGASAPTMLGRQAMMGSTPTVTERASKRMSTMLGSGGAGSATTGSGSSPGAYTGGSKSSARTSMNEA
jgi:hypothetical protein